MLALPMKGEKEQYVPEIRCEIIKGEPQRLTRAQWLADKPAYFDWVE
jgi:hypothetical protein